MQNLITSFKVSLENFKKLRVLTVASMLVALTVILGFMVIYIGPSIKISFAFVPVTAGSMLFGPVVGAVIGALGDIVGFFIKFLFFNRGFAEEYTTTNIFLLLMV